MAAVASLSIMHSSLLLKTVKSPFFHTVNVLITLQLALFDCDLVTSHKVSEDQIWHGRPSRNILSATKIGVGDAVDEILPLSVLNQ